MRIGVITEEVNNEDVAIALKNAGEKLGAEVIIIDPKECVVVNFSDPQILYKGEALENLDGCLVRGSEHKLDFKLYLVDYLAAMGTVMVNQSEAIRICNNKFETQSLLNSMGIKTPNTVALLTIEQLDAAVHLLEEKFPMIVKTVSGSHGVGVIKVDTYESLKSIVQLLLSTDTNLMLQEFIPHKESGRIMTLGDKVIASVMRSIPDGDFRSNMDQGAELTKYEATQDEGEVAIAVAEALGCYLCAIDYIIDSSGQMVIFEANSSPGLKGIQGVNDQVNIAEEIMKYVLALCEQGVDFEDEEEESKKKKKPKYKVLSYFVGVPNICKPQNDVPVPPTQTPIETNTDSSEDAQAATGGPGEEEEEESKDVVGLESSVIIKRINNDKPFKAKIDTGADRCSLHGENIDIQEDHVKFTIDTTTYKVPVERTVKVISANGEERRAIIKLNVMFNNESYDGVEFNIADRSDLQFEVIIGRNLLQMANVMVDPKE